MAVRRPVIYYFTIIDPISVNRQGNDVGTQLKCKRPTYPRLPHTFALWENIPRHLKSALGLFGALKCSKAL